MMSLVATVQCDDCGREETVDALTLHELTRSFPPLGWWIVEGRCPRDTDGDGDCPVCAAAPRGRRASRRFDSLSRAELRAHLGTEHLCPECVLARPTLPRPAMSPEAV